jgi:hypothetical protein
MTGESTSTKQRHAKEVEECTNEELDELSKAIETEKGKRSEKAALESFMVALKRFQTCFAHPVRWTVLELSPEEWLKHAEKRDCFVVSAQLYAKHAKELASAEDFLALIRNDIHKTTRLGVYVSVYSPTGSVNIDSYAVRTFLSKVAWSMDEETLGPRKIASTAESTSVVKEIGNGQLVDGCSCVELKEKLLAIQSTDAVTRLFMEVMAERTNQKS